MTQEEVTFPPWLSFPAILGGEQLSGQLDGKVFPVFPEQLLMVVVH